MARGAKAVRSAKRDRELEAGTSAHYEDPAYYTKNYRGRVEDVRYYVDLAKLAGRVVEFGCGNGRITIPSARAGAEMFGVDLSPAMLDDLKTKLASLPREVAARIKTKLGDMRTVRFAGVRAPLVTCPFNAFLHLYERVDVERFLETVRAHLEPRGTLVMDVSIPSPEELARDPNRAYGTPPFTYPEVGKVKYTERFDYDSLRQILFVAMEFHPVSGAASWMTPMAHRQFYPRELEALLHYNGFEIVAQYGDFDGSELSRASITQIVHARATGKKTRRG